MLYPRCMTYPGHFLTIHARHLDCLARFAGYHVFTLVLQIVTPVKYRLYLTFSFVLALQGFNILYMQLPKNSKQALGTAVTVNHSIDKVYQQVIKRNSFGLMTYNYFSVQFA